MLPVLVPMLNGIPVTAVGGDWWCILRDRVFLVLAVGLSTSSSVRTRAKQASKAMNELYKRKAQMRRSSMRVTRFETNTYVYLGA